MLACVHRGSPPSVNCASTIKLTAGERLRTRMNETRTETRHRAGHGTCRQASVDAISLALSLAWCHSIAAGNPRLEAALSTGWTPAALAAFIGGAHYPDNVVMPIPGGPVLAGRGAPGRGIGLMDCRLSDGPLRPRGLLRRPRAGVTYPIVSGVTLPWLGGLVPRAFTT
jgi:hypothetical protein